MSINEISTEVVKRAKKYQFDHPHTPYNEAIDIVLDDDPELAAAYSETDSPLTANIIRQFELDKKLKENPDDPARDITEYQYKVTMAEAMGWRDASRIYGVDIAKEITDALRRKILDLETKQILHQEIISNFPAESKRLKQTIDELKSQLGVDIGHTPSPEEIKEEQEKLLALHRNLAVAEEELPGIEAELKELRAKLEKIESGKKFSQQKHSPSPSAELTARAKIYSREHEIDYGIAVDEIMEEDLVLSTAYNLYDVDTLLGLNG